MISYKIISQELYANLQKLSIDFPTQKSFLIKANTQLIQKIHQAKEKTRNLELQLETQQSKTLKLSLQVSQLQTQLKEISEQLQAEIQNGKNLQQQQNETTIELNIRLRQKIDLEDQNLQLMTIISTLEGGLIEQNSKILGIQSRQQLLQTKIVELHQIISTLNNQKQELLKNLHQKQVTNKNLNFQLMKKIQLIDQVVAEYESCKEEKLSLQAEIQKFKESPISKLEEKIRANQTWINQLTKTINQLRQRCVQLQMDRPQFIQAYPANPNQSISTNHFIPYTIKPRIPYTKVPQNISITNNSDPKAFESGYFANKSRLQETQRLKYLAICKQFVQQCNAKLSKIQQQKKSMQEKFQTIKLKLNQYQYNQFKYKDKISLYMQKIERYQKLTQKQQEQMEKLILQFDEEINYVIKMKEEEVKSKLQQEIEKYQQKFHKMKESEEMPKRVQGQPYQPMRNSVTIDQFEYEMLKQQLQHAENELAQKSQQLQSVKKALSKTNKQLKKCKQSKQSYKEKYLKMEQECHYSSVQIRRYKNIVQELCQQLDTKSNDYQILKNKIIQNNTLSNGSNATNPINNCEETLQNLSAKFSSRNKISAGKKSGSDKYEYQVSQIDSQLQRRNQLLINHILLGSNLDKNHFWDFKTPAGPSRVSQHSEQAPNTQYWNRVNKPDLNESISSVSRSQISSQSQSESGQQNKTDSGNNSLNSSISSKNSYQSYGIKYLYKDKSGIVEGMGNKSLYHKNSLQ